MKITFTIDELVPRFIMADKNGRAVAKAIEKAFQYVAGATEDGLDIILDVDKMPEWRLDEMAWELNCLYDYHSDIGEKREWIRNATPYYLRHGTPKGVEQYLAPYFGEVDIQEFWKYGGDPFHFRVNLEGTLTEESMKWAAEAIYKSKNVRSILDAILIHSRMDAAVGVGSIAEVHHEIPVANDVEMENENAISLHMGVAGMGELDCVDVGDMGRQIEHTILAAASAGGVICCYNEIRLEVGS